MFHHVYTFEECKASIFVSTYLFTRADITYDGSINLQAIGKRGRSEDDIACLVLFWKITNVLPTNLL